MSVVLAELQEQVNRWHLHNFGPVDSWMPLLVAVEEVGELAHAHMKALQGLRTNEDHAAGKRDAVGDVVIALAAYCSREGIDFGACVAETWEKVRQRDWRANPQTGENRTDEMKG